MSQNRLIVIGGGNMARAILGGAVTSGCVGDDELVVVEPDAERRSHFQALGAQCFASTGEICGLLGPGSAVMLAIKPQMLKEATAPIRHSGFGGLVISILAGMGSDRVRLAMGGRCRVVRVMPNTPALVGMGVSGISASDGVEGADVAYAESLFRGVGAVVRVDEDQMDAVTAVSGSGPAYVFLLAQAMIEGAMSVGLDAETATVLVGHTIRGGAEMLVKSGDTTESLRRAVTSPKGTTEAAIDSMERDDLRGIVQRAIVAARDRGRELGKM